eukprot:5290300-Prymnesium_polylepis.5
MLGMPRVLVVAAADAHSRTLLSPRSISVREVSVPAHDSTATNNKRQEGWLTSALGARGPPRLGAPIASLVAAKAKTSSAHVTSSFVCLWPMADVVAKGGV